MGIYVEHVRIENFRSIKSLDIKLQKLNILIGHNNTGKSNFLSAIECGLKSHYDVEENDIYWGKEETKSLTKKAIIDLKIVPDDNEFDDSWSTWFGEEWINPDPAKQYVGIRTEICYDPIKGAYNMRKHAITNWGNSISESKVSNKLSSFRSEMKEYLNSFYVDASRDFSMEMKDKKSYFNRSIKSIDLGDEEKNEIENKLSELNATIINSIDEIKDTNSILSEIAPVIGIKQDSVVIEPLARNVDDLHKGLDVFIKEENSLSLPISNYGMGTKSWISFLSLKAYINYINKKIKKEDEENSEAYFMLLLEEPEAHLHPQAQKQLYNQLNGFSNQRIISTHSPSIVSQCKPQELISFYKENGETKAKTFDNTQYEKKELDKIKREILRSKGELLFSNYVILCEGITEEQELPLYFEKYFGYSPTYFGVSIVGVGGVNYGAFKKLFDSFAIKWIIISDGEPQTLNTLKRLFDLKEEQSLKDIENLFYYSDGDDIEKYLIRNNFSEEILKAIEIIEGEGKYEELIKNNPPKLTKTIKSDEVCPECKQNKKKEVEIDLDNLTEEQYTLYDYITRKGNKAKYSEQIALCMYESEKSIPSVFIEAFKKIKNELV